MDEGAEPLHVGRAGELKMFNVYSLVGLLTLLAVGGPLGSAAAGGRSQLFSTSDAASAEEREARPAASSGLGDWVGVYPFHNSRGLVIEEYTVVILDASGASLIFEDGQHCSHSNGTAKPAGANKVDIYYESEAAGCREKLGFSKGDLLVSIERKSRGYVFRWQALSLPLDGDPARLGATVYREDQGIAEDGKKIEGPYWGEGFFNRLSPAGVCGYDLRYRVFYNINPQAAAPINSALRAAAGVPSAEEMRECDEAHRREPQAEEGPRYCKEANEAPWVLGDRIGSALVQLSEGGCTPGPSTPRIGTERGLTFDLITGRLFHYGNLFRPESLGEVDKLMFSYLASKMKRAGIDYPWVQFLKDKKETYEFCLSSLASDRWAVTLEILDFPDDWFRERVSMNGGLGPGLSLDQLKSYANPGGPLALILSRK